MKFHIVRNNESLDDILFLYNLTKDELVEENRHIRVWDKLIPGTKIKIPPISEAVEQDVSDMEPFVEDYYPKLKQVTEDIYEEVKIKPEEDQKEEEQYIDNVQIFDSEKEVKEQVVDSDKVIKEQVTNTTPNEVKKEVPININVQSKEEKSKFVNPYLEKQNQYKMQQAYKPLPQNPYYAYPGYYNYPRYTPYPIIYYPIYYQKRSN